MGVSTTTTEDATEDKYKPNTELITTFQKKSRLRLPARGLTVTGGQLEEIKNPVYHMQQHTYFVTFPQASISRGCSA